MKLKDFVTRDLWQQLPDVWFSQCVDLVREDRVRWNAAAALARGSNAALQAVILDASQDAVAVAQNLVGAWTDGGVVPAVSDEAVRRVSAQPDTLAAVTLFSGQTNEYTRENIRVMFGYVQTWREVYKYLANAEAQGCASATVLQKFEAAEGFLGGVLASTSEGAGIVISGNNRYFTGYVDFTALNSESFIQMFLPITGYAAYVTLAYYVRLALYVNLDDSAQESMRQQSPDQWHRFFTVLTDLLSKHLGLTDSYDRCQFVLASIDQALRLTSHV